MDVDPSADTVELSDDAASLAEQFEVFCLEVEPRLRRALVAAFGADVGSDATSEALTWAWEHFDQVKSMVNPAGYLWRVGQSAARRERKRRQRRGLGTVAVHEDVSFEPQLVATLEALSVRQRTAVLLVHGYGFSLAEASRTMGCEVRTLRNHLDRGLRRLRAEIGVEDE